MDQQIPKISVVLATLNGSIETAFTAGGIIIQCEENDIPYEIIIVDNGSDKEHIDNLENFMRYHKDVPIALMEYGEVQGTIPPKRYGADQAIGEYLMFPDSHVLYSPNFFPYMIGHMDKYPEIAVLTAAAKTSQFGGVKEGYNMGHYTYSQIANHANRSEEVRSVFVHMLHGTIIKKDWFYKIGGFFPNSFKEAGGYCAEDMLLFLTTWMMGGKCQVTAKEASYHPVYRSGLPDRIRHDMHSSAPIAYYILGGEEWVHKFEKQVDQVYDLDWIKKQSQKDRDWVLENQKYTLDEVIEKL